MKKENSESKKILLIFYGGTIGQELQEIDGKMRLVSPENGERFKAVCAPILSTISNAHHVDIQFEVLSTMDSTNLNPSDWRCLILRIKKAQDTDGYDAVGIAHGTDTLAYSVTAVGLGLHGKVPGESGLRIPVVFTGAQNTIYVPGGDAMFNLTNLLRVLIEAIDRDVADVLVNFWNRVLLGVRTIKVHDKSFDAFMSPGTQDVGVIDANGIYLQTDLINTSITANSTLAIAPSFGSSVLTLELSPGLEPNTIISLVQSGVVSALILKSLGEGNVCSEGAYSLLHAIKIATEEYAIPVLIASKFVGGSTGAAHYDVGIKAIEAGGIPCFDHTDIAVDVKTRWLLGNAICADREGFLIAMRTAYAGEVSLIE